ncbi:MAG TPA: helix-turn-helix transcriptional regulator [Gemmatimonadaceae bacterium]
MPISIRQDPSPAPTSPPSFGALLREWRRRRNLSQLALALESDISQRHISFVESGRARPSREMVLRLAEHLEVPLRERNRLLLAAGFAPVYQERPLTDPALDAARRAVERVLAGHEPYPALAVDRHWTLVAANRALAPLLDGIAPALLAPPVNVLRLSLHPDGLAPRIVNFGQWRAHLHERVRQQIEASGDPTLAALLDELRALPAPRGHERRPPAIATDGAGVFVPLQLASGDDVLTFMSTTMVFGTAVDVTLSELALECFFPANAATAEALREGGGQG